jgi:signal transduction histidine kinase
VQRTAALPEVLRRHAARLDLLLGVLVAVFGVLALWSTPALSTFDYREPDALGVGLTVLGGAAVAARSRLPLSALAVACAAALVPLQLGYPQGPATFAPLLVLYTIASRRPASTSASAAVAVYLLVGLLLLVGPIEPNLTDWVGNTFMVVAVWAVGRSVRSRRAENAGREERNRALVEAEAARARAVELDERASIAREMHDLVTHGLTALTVQTAAARRLLRTDPDTAGQLLAGVERAGHEAIADMRRILGLLRPADGPVELNPQPGLSELDALVDDARAGGLDVELVRAGTPGHVDDGVALTAYRIVQEALSNTRQHAGQATARVSLTWTADRLQLAVEDDGRGVLDWPDASGAGGHAPAGPDGHGLRSLRERVQACGGSFHAQPRPGGGFVVTATLPTAPARTRPASRPTTPPTARPTTRSPS